MDLARFPLALLFAAVPLAAETWFIPAAANIGGAYGTNWRTEAVFVNPGSEAVCADLFFLEAGKDNAGAAPYPLEVPAGHAVTLEDLIGTFFASPGRAGAVKVEADGPLVITTRTYNDLGESGTYGQSVPALPPASVLNHGGPRTLFPLIQTEAYRTNLGLVNAGPVPVRVVAKFFDGAGDGREPWSVLEWDLAAFEYRQVNLVLEQAGLGGAERAYARLSVSTPGGAVFPWVSIADRLTGDPVFTPAAEAADLTAPPAREWVRAVGWSGDDLAHAVAAADEGGLWAGGETASTGEGTGDAWIFKVDPQGRIGPMAVLDGAGQDKLFGLQPLSGGGAVLCGAATVPGSPYWYGWALAVDGAARPLWSRRFDRPESAWLYAILPMPDGTFRACGQLIPADGTPDDAWVLAFDATGAILWQERFRGPRLDWFYAIAPAGDGGVVVAGATQSFGGPDYDAWLVRLDADGGVAWERTYGGDGQDAAYAIVRRPGGGWAVAGQTDSWGEGGGDLWLFAVDGDGMFQWGRTLGTKDWDTAYALAAAPDGRILTGGQKGSAMAGKGDAWLAEWDDGGSLLARSVLDGALPERLYGASVRPDGGWLASGRTESAGAGRKDLLLISWPAGLVPAEPCPFQTTGDWTPKPTPPVGQSVGSLILAEETDPRPWMEPLPPASEPADTVLCGKIHAGPFRSLVPAAARTDGAYGTRWRTDLFLLLPSDGAAARVLFLRSGLDNPDPAGAVVAGGASELIRVPDVLGSLFSEESAFGALLIEANDPVEAWTVTYTEGEEGGTHGQSIPAFAEEACLRNGEAAVLAGLIRSPHYRTNLGFAGPGTAATEVGVEVFASDGAPLGTRSFTLPAAGHLQFNDFLLGFGERMEGAWAVVRPSGEGACLFAYASVADNRTGDPVYIPAARTATRPPD